MKFLFWNINKKDNLIHIKDIVLTHNLDFIIIAECDIKKVTVLENLNSTSNDFYFYDLGKTTKIKIFGKYHPDFVKVVLDIERRVAIEINDPLFGKILLIALHYQSKNNWELDDQSAHVPSLNSFINTAEAISGLNKTIVVGDFNMNPFDAGMVQTTGLHAVMDRKIALKKSRIIEGIEYKFFYNPMWSFFGDDKKEKGTFYKALSKPIVYYWNILDQVLIRPELIDSFDFEFLNIVISTGKNDLLTTNGYIRNDISDHLPIKFSIKNKQNII